jgi:hypothetical protein
MKPSSDIVSPTTTLPIPASSLVGVVIETGEGGAIHRSRLQNRVRRRDLDSQEICAICGDFSAMSRMGMARTR